MQRSGRALEQLELDGPEHAPDLGHNHFIVTSSSITRYSLLEERGDNIVSNYLKLAAGSQPAADVRMRE